MRSGRALPFPPPNQTEHETTCSTLHCREDLLLWLDSQQLQSMLPPSSCVLVTHSLKALYAQAALVVESDDGGFLSSISPAPDAFRNETPGSEIIFNVSMSSDAALSMEGGEITLSFQGHRVNSCSCITI